VGLWREEGCGNREPAASYAVEEPYRRITEVAAYVAERGTLEKEKYNDLYRRFRGLYPLPAQGADEDETRTPPHVASALGEEVRKSPGSSTFNSNMSSLRR